MIRVGPCVDGSYPLLTMNSMALVWLGGQNLSPLKVLAAEWRSGSYHLAIEVGTIDHRVWQMKARGAVDNADGLLGSLLGQMIKQIPSALPGGVERSRIVDFMFDQLFYRQRREIPMSYRRLSKGMSNRLWLTEDGKASLVAKYPTTAQAVGEIMLHPSIFMARQLGYCPVRTSKGCVNQIVPDIYAMHAVKQAIIVIDEKNPPAREEANSLSPMGIIITGKRSGLEKWARRYAARNKHPLIVISRQSHLDKVRHYLDGALLIGPNNTDRLRLGNLRADISAVIQENPINKISA